LILQNLIPFPQSKCKRIFYLFCSLATRQRGKFSYLYSILPPKKIYLDSRAKPFKILDQWCLKLSNCTYNYLGIILIKKRAIGPLCSNIKFGLNHLVSNSIFIKPFLTMPLGRKPSAEPAKRKPILLSKLGDILAMIFAPAAKCIVKVIFLEPCLVR